MIQIYDIILNNIIKINIMIVNDLHYYKEHT